MIRYFIQNFNPEINKNDDGWAYCFLLDMPGNQVWDDRRTGCTELNNYLKTVPEFDPKNFKIVAVDDGIIRQVVHHPTRYLNTTFIGMNSGFQITTGGPCTSLGERTKK